MVLTRQQRERFVLDLYNQGKSTREIAEEAILNNISSLIHNPG